MTYTIVSEIRLDLIECCVCGVVFGIGETFNLSLYNEKNLWYCHNGHSQLYTALPIRVELTEAKNKNFMLEQERDRARDDAARKSKQITVLKKRLKDQPETGKK